MGHGPLQIPNPLDNAIPIADVEVWEERDLNSGYNVLRGWMPGMLNPLSKVSSLSHGALVEGSDGLAGRQLMLQQLHFGVSSPPVCFFDLMGPWR
jgi:hypothetical protein